MEIGEAEVEVVEATGEEDSLKIKIKITKTINKNQERDQDIVQTHRIAVVTTTSFTGTKVGFVKPLSSVLGRTKS